MRVYRSKPRPRGLRKAIKRAGNMTRLAERLGLTRQAVQDWADVPEERCVEVYKVTGIPPDVLRPDIIWVKDSKGRYRSKGKRAEPISTEPELSASCS